jgi:hypothetical protein
MPTLKAGAETQQNPIRFKNLMRQAEALLQEQEASHTDAVDLLKSAHQLDQNDFGQHQEEGLAIFIAEGFLRYYPLPLSFAETVFAETVVVGDRFHLKPLLPLLTGDGQYYVLALSQNDIRLIQATRHSVQEIELEDSPKSLDEALQYDRPDEEIQYRISTYKGGTDNSFQQAGSFHGVGSPDTDRVQEDILQFFHQVDHGLHGVLRNKQAPLVLAGVEYLMPIYRKANTYAHLVDEGRYF